MQEAYCEHNIGGGGEHEAYCEHNGCQLHNRTKQCHCVPIQEQKLTGKAARLEQVTQPLHSTLYKFTQVDLLLESVM